MCVLMQTLKILKKSLIQWNKDRIGDVDDRVKVAKEELKRVQTRL